MEIISIKKDRSLELQEMRDNMKETILIKIDAHMIYLMNHLFSHKQKRQVVSSFNQIKNYIEDGYMPDPDQMYRNSYIVDDDETTHRKVLEVYTDIYNGMYKKFFGRSEDSIIEKL